MEKILRRMARSHKYQFLYSKAKDLGNIKIFKNDSDFSDIQLLFLQWLDIYYILGQDLNMKEDYISEEILQDNLRTDAYLLYRLKFKNKKQSKEKKVDIDSGVPGIVFRRNK